MTSKTLQNDFVPAGWQYKQCRRKSKIHQGLVAPHAPRWPVGNPDQLKSPQSNCVVMSGSNRPCNGKATRTPWKKKGKTPINIDLRMGTRESVVGYTRTRSNLRPFSVELGFGVVGYPNKRCR